MRITVYGGSFDPPHIGHVSAAKAAAQASCGRFLIIPDCEAPHKEMDEAGASPEDRLQLCRLAFSDVPNAEISDMEIRRGGKSYTSDTLHAILSDNPGAELSLVVGTDMLMSFDSWYDAGWLMKNVRLLAVARDRGEREAMEGKASELREKFGAEVLLVDAEPVPVSSSAVREMLRHRQGCELLTPETYAYIIKRRLYGAKPSFEWLRERAKEMLKPKRVPHVLGCEQEARHLALRWGESEEDAAEAAILHDITKKLELTEQLLLCGKYGIIPDAVEEKSQKLLHAKTGAAVARYEFGVSDRVYEAIRWHTTGKSGMTMLEQIMYMADYIEPTRDFDGVEELRRLAYTDMDEAMLLGLKMSLEEIIARGEYPHSDSRAAAEYFEKRVESKKTTA